jgi:hypothetical protein
VKRVVNPGAPDMVKPKRTSAEVTAVAKRKATLQRQADKLEQQRIDTLAEMELEEELDDVEAERNVVRKLAHTDSLDDIEDVVMQPATDIISEFSLSTSEDDEARLPAPKISRKKPRVCFFGCCRDNK